MRSLYHLVLVISALTVYYSFSAAYQVPDKSLSLDKVDHEETFRREKRQMENFDDEYPSATNQDAQEEPGFWDRIVKVAVKLFSKFIEWLNS